MQEVLVKTHLIIKDIHDEYNMDWCGKFIDVKPKLRNGKPIFIVAGSLGRTEVNTSDINELEKLAKAVTCPKGRKAIATDKSRVFIVQEDGTNKLMGILTHDRIKKFAPMYDKVGYR